MSRNRVNLGDCFCRIPVAHFLMQAMAGKRRKKWFLRVWKGNPVSAKTTWSGPQQIAPTNVRRMAMSQSRNRFTTGISKMQRGNTDNLTSRSRETKRPPTGTAPGYRVVVRPGLGSGWRDEPKGLTPFTEKTATLATGSKMDAGRKQNGAGEENKPTNPDVAGTGLVVWKWLNRVSRAGGIKSARWTTSERKLRNGPRTGSRGASLAATDQIGEVTPFAGESIPGIVAVVGPPLREKWEVVIDEMITPPQRRSYQSGSPPD